MRNLAFVGALVGGLWLAGCWLYMMVWLFWVVMLVAAVVLALSLIDVATYTGPAYCAVAARSAMNWAIGASCVLIVMVLVA